MPPGQESVDRYLRSMMMYADEQQAVNARSLILAGRLSERNRLRAKVEALPSRGLEIPYDDDIGEGHELVWRSDVLAVFDEALDG